MNKDNVLTARSHAVVLLKGMGFCFHPFKDHQSDILDPAKIHLIILNTLWPEQTVTVPK